MDATQLAAALRDPQVQRMGEVAARAERERQAQAWLDRQFAASTAAEFAEVLQRVRADVEDVDVVGGRRRLRPAPVAARARRKRKLAAIARRKSRR